MGRKHASRKYTDLIMAASSRWANWEPAIRMEAGDYGSINRITGQFEHEGNIYRNNDLQIITKEHPPETGPVIQNLQIHSMDARKFGAEPDVHTNFFGMGEPSFGGQWQFGRSRGALLLMYGCQITSMPNDLLATMIKSDWTREKYIVTRVYSCRGYFLYLSDKSCSSNENVSVDLRFDAPLAAAPGITPGAALKGCWHANGLTGICHRAFGTEPLFFPLYHAQRLGKRPRWFRRDPGFDDDDDDDGDSAEEEEEEQEEAKEQEQEEDQELEGEEEESWLPVEVPWNCLDEDGRELTDEFPQGDSDTDIWDDSEIH